MRIFIVNKEILEKTQQLAIKNNLNIKVITFKDI